VTLNDHDKVGRKYLFICLWLLGLSAGQLKKLSADWDNILRISSHWTNL